ncbi:shieldin complex subunit 3 [Perognathus longimembris pacificus]|uniref:shieldin complex subunit 3 n=1 Tax=Perognathus longimembris pacificus TaxID=214514 RepID=UPI002019C493|nr:shieldin complex subunit 3 [Perognathus longimembris pacificus]
MTTQVILHYRPYEYDCTHLPKIAEKAIQDFPTHPLSRFIPWFPHDGSKLPLKPKGLPPVISGEAAENVKQNLTISEHGVKTLSYDCTVDLLEFQPALKRQRLIQSYTLSEQTNSGNLDEKSGKRRQYKKRSWSVTIASKNCAKKIFPLSKKLQESIKALNLHSLYRARWTIEHTVCDNQSLEDIWVKLNRIIRHNELPSCNATIQRHIGQIWVFCDILYCEYVGNLLKVRLDLNGKISLFVHKYGVIFSM